MRVNTFGVNHFFRVVNSLHNAATLRCDVANTIIFVDRLSLYDNGIIVANNKKTVTSSG